MFINMLRSCAVLFVVGMTACGGAISSPNEFSGGTPVPNRTPFATPTPVGLETPAAGKIYFGAYAASTPTLATLQTQINRKVAMDMHYYGWTGNFPLTPEDSDIVNGQLPIDSWNCQLSDAQVAAGAGDLLIQTRALAVKNFGHPVFIRYFSEMNEHATVLGHSACYDPATDNADTTFSATQYVAAWQHIRQIFTLEQVTNAIWIWSFSASGANPAPYYPGDAFVDWVGIDAYDVAGGPGLASVISPAYAIAASFQKPIIISEAGENQTNQPVFFNTAATTLQTSFPLVQGFVYYDAFAALNAVVPKTDWRIATPAPNATPPTANAAFTTFANAPYLSAFASSL